MKRSLITLTVVLAAICLAILFGAPKAQNFNSSAAIAAPAPAPVPMAVPMPHRCPNIHEAIEMLQSAQSTLREARHDFCGHKHEAMEAVHVAIVQLRQAENCQQCRD